MTPKDCKHPKFTSYVSVGRIVAEHELAIQDKVKPVSLVLDLKLQCSECGTPVAFTGLSVGSVKRGATTSFDGLELRASAVVREFPS